MKKFLALVLALAVVCSFGITAFAAGSPVAPIYTEKTTSEFPVPEVAGLDIFKIADDTFVATIPAEDVVLLSVGNADDLSDEDKAAFLKAYDDVKAIEDEIVNYFFWLGVKEGVEVKEDEYVKFPFNCQGENVKVTVNGEEMEVVATEEANSYYAKLVKLGAVAICSDAE